MSDHNAELPTTAVAVSFATHLMSAPVPMTPGTADPSPGPRT